MSQQPRTVLITGATGYIGRRLKDRLLKQSGLSLRLLVRNPDKLRPDVRKKLAVFQGDTFNTASLDQALADVDVAFYLIHSMAGGDDYAKRDRLSADNFRQACIRAGVKRIIYLGGLGDKETASEHLLSRIETGEVLSSEPEKIQTLWFRAGVIIGAGSASFEIIHHLTQKLPIMLTPRWVTTRTQPIAVDDVLAYLEQAISADIQGNVQIDIGTQATDFRGLMEQAADSMGLQRHLICVPLLSPRLSSYWLTLLTPVPHSVASALIEGLKSETLARNDNAQRYFPTLHPVALDDAFQRALQEMEDNQVLSRWCDSSAEGTCDISGKESINKAVLRDRRVFYFEPALQHEVFESFCSIGGSNGWGAYDPLWHIRGLIDKIFGGVGLSRGRRQPEALRVGDALDFWKVVDIEADKRLLLVAQMKLPGKGWLEFVMDDDKLIQTAYFYPEGLWGRLYWYSVMPFHFFVFRSLGRLIIEQARQKKSSPDVV
ncbi:SDR family oxidoreductase [uncultured Desulfuromonas sp.]|uniref:SDR family oxidoreductase n=1 Tax=uncultured Desulfuromonas sp. TaxID=181013 RepID=UPI002AAB614D|nr:SDR family oxidoreductase [uncultured Desulfuromonas sp.]